MAVAQRRAVSAPAADTPYTIVEATRGDYLRWLMAKPAGARHLYKIPRAARDRLMLSVKHCRAGPVARVSL